jgi:hypothetical protein
VLPLRPHGNSLHLQRAEDGVYLLQNLSRRFCYKFEAAVIEIPAATTTMTITENVPEVMIDILHRISTIETKIETMITMLRMETTTKMMDVMMMIDGMNVTMMTEERDELKR